MSNHDDRAVGLCCEHGSIAALRQCRSIDDQEFVHLKELSQEGCRGWCSDDIARLYEIARLFMFASTRKYVEVDGPTAHDVVEGILSGKHVRQASRIAQPEQL